MNYPANRLLWVVFQPNSREPFAGRRRFLVGCGSLYKYVGKKNAITAFERALKSDGDKITVKLRKHGRIDFYFK